MTQVLLAVFRDKELSRLLAFKGGTSLLMFHALNRFSTDLDFNLLDPTQTKLVYDRLKTIVAKYGTIDDEAMKFFGLIFVMSYAKGERMLKIEVSNRQYDNHYETINLLGTDIRVMTMPDMFAHKLCALGERITPRDVYDVCYFLQRHTEVNANIVRLRTDMSLQDYLMMCAEKVRHTSSKMLMQGLGEVLIDTASKKFVKNGLVEETATGLELFAMYPLVAQQEPTARLQMLDANPEVLNILRERNIDLSTITEQVLIALVDDHKSIILHNRYGQEVEVCL